jgi:hypothetical protein
VEGITLRSDLAVLTGGPGLLERFMSILRSLADKLWAARPYVTDDDVWLQKRGTHIANAVPSIAMTPLGNGDFMFFELAGATR